MTPSKAAFLETALLKAFARTAGAEIISSQLFFQQLVAVDDPQSTLDLRFGRESPTPLTHRLEKNSSSSSCSWIVFRTAHLPFWILCSTIDTVIRNRFATIRNYRTCGHTSDAYLGRPPLPEISQSDT